MRCPACAIWAVKFRAKARIWVRRSAFVPVGVSLAGIALGARPSPDADHCLGKYLPITTFVNGSSSSQCNSVKPNSRPSIGSDPIVPIAAAGHPQPSTEIHSQRCFRQPKMFAVASRESAIDVGCALVPIQSRQPARQTARIAFRQAPWASIQRLARSMRVQELPGRQQPQVSGRAWLHRFHRCPIERKEICGGLHCIDNQSTQQAI